MEDVGTLSTKGKDAINWYLNGSGRNGSFSSSCPLEQTGLNWGRSGDRSFKNCFVKGV